MAYISCFALPLPDGHLEEYISHAAKFRDVMREQGVLHYYEAKATDVPRGKQTDFYRAVDACEDETVIVGFAVWPDRHTADEAMKVAMEHPSLKEMTPQNMPFDGMRMFWGGFDEILSL